MGGLEIHFKVWLEKEGKVVFGRGRLELLKGIRDYGSLAETARHLGMSYRAAWGRLKSSENRLGVQLVEKVPGKGRGQRLILTPLSQGMLQAFEGLEQELQSFLAGRKDRFDEQLRSLSSALC
ncbi:MAG: LysR family transcriptional regulator [Deltaproteobacteria bacterium]|nr:LysR family transcriptional regulator [Deltaproteobacteria bacterium]